MEKSNLEFMAPYEVGDLVVFLIDANHAKVIDYDCRYELNTTLTTCDCCTYKFYSRNDPKFKCRHIQALHHILKVD